MAAKPVLRRLQRAYRGAGCSRGAPCTFLEELTSQFVPHLLISVLEALQEASCVLAAPQVRPGVAPWWLTKPRGLDGVRCLRAALSARGYLLRAVQSRGVAAVFALTWSPVTEGLPLQKHPRVSDDIVGSLLNNLAMTDVQGDHQSVPRWSVVRCSKLSVSVLEVSHHAAFV